MKRILKKIRVSPKFLCNASIKVDNAKQNVNDTLYEQNHSQFHLEQLEKSYDERRLTLLHI